MFRLFSLIMFLSLATGTAAAQGDLSELFSILRTEGPALSESGRARTFQILEPYSKGTKSLDGEWQALNAALSGSSAFHAFRFTAPTDSRVIALVIEALKDPDYYVRQEAIAAVSKIGKPASAALPLLNVIRDRSAGTDERDQSMRMNAEAAIRVLSKE